jgi:hypothetical protein
MSMGPSKYENNFPDRQCLNINKVVCSFINVKSIRKVSNSEKNIKRY